MPKLTDIITTQDVLDYTVDKPFPTQVGEALFPATRQDSLDLKYIVGTNQAPVSASVHAFNTESEIASRQGAKEVIGKIALIKKKIGVDEELLIKLNSVREGSPAYQAVIERIYNDVDAMVAAVNVRIERMRYEALSTGKIEVKENGAKFSIDYGLKADQKEDLGTKWDENTENIIDVIYETVDKLVAKGITPTRILTSRRVLAVLARNKALQKAVFGANNARLLSLNDLNEFFKSQALPVIGTEDRVFRLQKTDGSYATQRYLADNKFIYLPDGPVGHTVFGPTPEEIRLSQNPAIDLSKVGNVLAMVYDEDVDPVATYTKAVATALPSFEGADQVHIADVLAPKL